MRTWNIDLEDRIRTILLEYLPPEHLPDRLVCALTRACHDEAQASFDRITNEALNSSDGSYHP